MTISPLRFFCGLVCVAAMHSASAEPVELSPVTVTGSRTASIAEQLPTGTVVLEKADIEQIPATNLADVLDTVAGINVRRQFGVDGSRANIDMMGFGARGNQNTLVLLNGHRFSSVDLSGPQLGSIPVAAIERIEVLPGAGAALYGNGAVGGAINIVTRQSFDTGAGASVSGGGYDRVGANAWGSHSHENVNIAASLDALNAGGYRDNNELKQRNGFLDLRHNSDAGSFFVTTSLEEQSLGLPGGRSGFFGSQAGDFENNPRGADDPSDWADQDSVTVSPGIHVPVNDMLELRLDGQFRDKTQDFYFEDFGSLAYGDNRIITRSISPRIVLTPTTGQARHQLRIGWDRYEYDYKARYAGSPSQLNNSGDTKDVEQVRESLFIHDTIALNESWSVSVGGRTLDVETESRGRGSLFAGQGSDDSDEEMYEGGIRYHLTDSFSAFVGAQRSVRLFNADEINPASGAETRPQTGRTYTLGASWQEDKQHSTMTVWRGRFEDEIVYDPATFSNTNLEDPTLRKGVSLNSRWELDDGLFLSLNGTHQWARFRGGANEGNTVPLVPRQTARAQLEYQAGDGLTITLAQRYVGKQYMDEDFANANPRLDSYRMSDAILRKTIQRGFIEFAVYNLTDERRAADYAILTPFETNDYSAFPLPGRQVVATLGAEW
jgi:iron complex outermembrane receptor protein